MSYTQVKIQFMLSHKGTSDEFTFWTCVLDTDVPSIDYDFLTKNTKPINICVDGFIVSAVFSAFDGNINGYIKRNPVFLPVDKNSAECSPYISSCAELTNYYAADFPANYVHFLEDIESTIKKEFSEYEKLEIQKKSISAIKDIIGIDVLEQESVPSSIAVYRRFPVFTINANYNSERGERYIKVSFDQESGCTYLLEIEIPDDKKILYKQIHELKPNEKIILPEIKKLEDFGQVHLSIFRQRNTDDSTLETCIVYEESGYLIRSFSFGVNTGGGNYKVIQNRFTGKKIEKIALTYHSLTSSRSANFEPYLMEREYKNDIFGKEKKYLESKFFSDDENGRSSFLDWVRNVLRQAKKVTIIDPFFDMAGFNDFNTCATTYFSLTVLTTDPIKCPRDGQNEEVEFSENLVKLITQSFQNAKVYYLDRAKLHDRYLIVSDGEDTTYYNLSNSWNGTVNNYSLFVQELELSIALQVKDCYSKYLDEQYLQKIEIPRVIENKNDGKKICVSAEDVQRKFSFVQDAKELIKNDDFKVIFSDLFTADYYGCEKLDEFKLLPLCITKLQLIDDNELFVHSLVSEILEQQKKQFIKEQRFISNDKSLEEYTDILTCLQLTSNRHFCSGIPYYDLKIEYAQYKLLEACFALFPALVIKELCEQEKAICVFNSKPKTEIKYSVSEQIVSYMLSENFRYFPEQKSDELVDFANNSENLYCKIYIAQWILDSDDSDNSFENKLTSLLNLKLAPKDIAILLGSFCSELLRIESETSRTKKELVVSFITKNYAQNKDALIRFALYAYIFSYEIYFEDFRAFTNKNQNVVNELNTIVLLCSLNSVPSKKLSLLLEKHIDKELFSYLPKSKENPSITAVGKYLNYIPYIGQSLVEIVKDTPELQKGLMYRFELQPNFIFEINKHPADEFDCYVLLIILNALYEMKQQGIDVTSEINSIKWYMPYLLNMHDGDFYGLTFKILDVYATFITDSEKVVLKDKLISEKQKLFLVTTLQDRDERTIERIQKLVNDYSFYQYDKTNSIIYLLALFMNLVFYSKAVEVDNATMLQLFSDIKGKFAENIKSEKIQNCVEKGIAFYSVNTEENKRLFMDEIKSLYCPYTVYKFVEEYNG